MPDPVPTTIGHQTVYSTVPDLNGPDGILLTFPVRSLPVGDDVVRFSDEHLQNFDAQLFVYMYINLTHWPFSAHAGFEPGPLPQ